MKVLVVDNESHVRGNYRRLLREVGGHDHDDGFDEIYDDPRPAPPPPTRLRPRRQAYAERPHYEEPQAYQNEYGAHEGYEQNPYSSVGSENMSSFAQTSDTQFAAVEDAVLQTPRGRWFLAEYLRRHRTTDTDRVLNAIESLRTHVTSTVTAPRENAVSTAIRRELQEIAVTIVHARRDIAALKLDPNAPSFAHATDELDTVVASSERATGDILSSVERLQDVSLRLRSKGGDLTECEAIETQAITILRACSSQDITGQRVSRIVNALRIVEQRVAAALDAIIESEGSTLSQPYATQDFFQYQTSQYQTPQYQTQEHQPAQTPPRGEPTTEANWVTPAADRIIRGESGGSDLPFEQNLARSY
jgi:chemotaxis regulatin CheY-phosphate phosphatase CheZ